MKKLLSSLLIIFICGLFGQEVADEPIVLSSGEAEYNGKEISLIGHAVVQHGLGKIVANRLTLVPADKDKKSKFAFLKMDDGVSIELREGGQIQCQHAEIDCLELKGNFFGDAQQPDVIYTEMHKDGLQIIPLTVKSHYVQAKLMREKDDEANSNRTVISQIEAQGDIRVDYQNEYFVVSDYASYQRLPSKMSNAGLLSLAMIDSTQRPCAITNRNGDHIQANMAVIDTQKRQLVCQQPQGWFYLRKENSPVQPIQFSSRQLIWDDINQMFILQGQVKINQSNMGELTTNDEMRLYQHVIDGTKTIKSILSPQETELIYTDQTEQKLIHRLLCHGPLIVDHEHLQAFFYSPKDDQGQVQSEQQVYFEDLLGDIYADHMQFDYEWIDHKLFPSKLTMQGHVKILNRYDGHIQESSSVLQYALADQVEYFPKNKEMVLSSLKGQRVLFYDKVNNVQMSAPSLKIRRDENSQKGSIQGIGDVRFTFIENEFDQLRQRFQLDKPTQ